VAATSSTCSFSATRATWRSSSSTADTTRETAFGAGVVGVILTVLLALAGISVAFYGAIVWAAVAASAQLTSSSDETREVATRATPHERDLTSSRRRSATTAGRTDNDTRPRKRTDRADFVVRRRCSRRSRGAACSSRPEAVAVVGLPESAPPSSSPSPSPSPFTGSRAFALAFAFAAQGRVAASPPRLTGRPSLPPGAHTLVSKHCFTEPPRGSASQ